MTRVKVYKAISAVAAAISTAGIPKGRLNLRDQYFYRSIDDVVAALAPLFARHKLCVLPRVLERVVSEWTSQAGERLISVTLKVAFDLVSADDASSHTVEAYGEALDPGDKATAKAMTAAYKSAMGQAFCIPVVAEDADSASYRRPQTCHDPQPVEGWEQWSREIIATIEICETREALERVQFTHRSQLQALAREKRDLYDSVGQAFSHRVTALTRPPGTTPGNSAAEADCDIKRPRSRAKTSRPKPELVGG